MRPDEVRHVYRENLKTLMIASNDKVDDLAVFLQWKACGARDSSQRASRSRTVC